MLVGSLRSFKYLRFCQENAFSSSTTLTHDLQYHFLNPRIHNLLHGLVSESQPNKIHESRFKVAKVHDIKLLSDSELQSVLRFSNILSSQKLQMPPVMNERPPDKHQDLIIAQNPELCGVLPSNQKLVFVDIGLDSSRRRRLMLIRDASGALRYANSSERDRLNQIFFPLPGRRLRTPSLFQDANIEVALKNGLHEYLLDLIMIQFEPDSPDYIRISRKVYDDAASKIWTSIKSENKCENVVSRLRLTRHYGPFVLYVISRLQQPACLVQEALHHRSIDVVYKLLILTSLLHPDSNFAQKVITFGIPPQNADFDCIIPETGAILHLVRVFIDTWSLESEQKNQLDLSLSQCYQSNQTDTSNMQSEMISSFTKEVKFYFSLFYGTLAHKMGARSWYDRIDDKLVLGALPILPEWDAIMLREGISHVISMVEPFEVKSFVLGPREAADRGIRYLSLPVQDFVGVPSVEQVNAGLDFIDSCQGSGNSVYIHCKAGRTRSAYLVACYYMSAFDISPEEAVAHIQNYRPHVVFSRDHWRGLYDYFRLLHLRHQ